MAQNNFVGGFKRASDGAKITFLYPSISHWYEVAGNANEVVIVAGGVAETVAASLADVSAAITQAQS